MDAISTSNMAGVFVLINDKVEMESDPKPAVAKLQTYNKISLEQKKHLKFSAYSAVEMMKKMLNISTQTLGCL